jgi:hypothetical protein
MLTADYSLQGNDLYNAAINPDDYLDKLHFHSNLDYMKIIAEINISSISFNGASRPTDHYDGGKSNNYDRHYPATLIETVYGGATNESTPRFIFVDDGVGFNTSSFVRENVSSGIVEWRRVIYPVLGAGGTIRFTSMGIALNSSMPALTINNLRVLICG